MKGEHSHQDGPFTGEDGPFHARGHLKAYCEFLEKRGMHDAVEALRQKHPREFEQPAKVAPSPAAMQLWSDSAKGHTRRWRN